VTDLTPLPSPTQTDQVVQFLGGTKLPSTDQATAFYGDEFDMMLATGRSGLFKGFYLPEQDSRHDFFALVSSSEQFAAITGQRYYPTPVQLQWGVEHGILSQGDDAVYSWLAGIAGIADAMPWAALGMNRTTYDQTQNNYRDIVEELTGSRAGADDALVRQATHERWSTTRFRQHLLDDATFQEKNPHTKWGFTYQSFQQYKRENRQAVEQRFGTGAATDANYLAALEKPLTAFSATGSTTQYQPTSSAAVGGPQSQVR
jgi:hypothetical protein